MTLREKVARALLASARSMKQVLPEWDDAARWRFPETGLTMQEVALAEADAALAVVREALREPSAAMFKAFHEGESAAAASPLPVDTARIYNDETFRIAWPLVLAASPLSEGTGMVNRLSIADCRVGMLVECVDNSNRSGQLTNGVVYKIKEVAGSEIMLVGVRAISFLPSRFIPADPAPQPAMTAELVAAMREWHAEVLREEALDPDWLMRRQTRQLRAAIERAGILAEPAPRVTDVQAQIGEGWWA